MRCVCVYTVCAYIHCITLTHGFWLWFHFVEVCFCLFYFHFIYIFPGIVVFYCGWKKTSKQKKNIVDLYCNVGCFILWENTVTLIKEMCSLCLICCEGFMVKIVYEAKCTKCIYLHSKNQCREIILMIFII